MRSAISTFSSSGCETDIPREPGIHSLQDAPKKVPWKSGLADSSEGLIALPNCTNLLARAWTKDLMLLQHRHAHWASILKSSIGVVH
jgi:hypothetical protein